MENRKRIIELLTAVRYTTNDIEKVADEICSLFSVVGQSGQLVCPKCGSKTISSAIDSNNNGCNDCSYNWVN